jgi:hypothetical protein
VKERALVDIVHLKDIADSAEIKHIVRFKNAPRRMRGVAACASDCATGPVQHLHSGARPIGDAYGAKKPQRQQIGRGRPGMTLSGHLNRVA